MVWKNRVSHQIQRIGYDSSTSTMAVIFTDATARYYRPVPYSLYTGFAHARFPDQFYRHVIEGKIPLVHFT
ncbi:MAG TPA: KTSC domain-containing protein [Methanoregula sp.]|nr:KTSC domain-containing protein [Methanoregula sp.]